MKKSAAYPVIVILVVVTAASVAYGVVSYRRLVRDERFLSAFYQHAFTQFVADVADVDSALQKSLLVTSSPMAGAVCSELYAKSLSAGMALGGLPFSSSEFENTSSFLNKTGDYALALSKKSYSGESFSEEDRENLLALSDTASILSQNLKSIQDDMGSNILELSEYSRGVQEMNEGEDSAVPATIADSMSLAEKEFPEVPSLIYDGPFSENLAHISPRFLEGKDEIDVSEGRTIAAGFLGIREERVYPTYESDGDIPCYYYECEQNGSTVSIWVTKTGGAVLSVLGTRYVESAKLDAQQALDAAQSFLRQHGYDNMKESYYLISDNVLTANFSYVQDGVVCYSDLVKVGIALDDGSLKSFDATGYITTHYDRQLPEAEISQQEAQSGVVEGLNILDVNTVLIPSDGKIEIFCYEFECEDNNKQKYIVYVNAVTGVQEKILILIEDENGTLTI